MASRGAFRFWRWLTCGHGRHAWQLNAGIDLAAPTIFHEPVFWYSHNPGILYVTHSCPRCGLVEVLE